MNKEIAQEVRHSIIDRHSGSPLDENWTWMINTRTIEFIEQHYAAAETYNQAMNMVYGDAHFGEDADPVNWDAIDDAEDEEFDPMEMYHDWVSDRAMSIFSSGATSEEAMFMARQEAAHLFPDEHREAMTPPHYKAQAAQAAKAQPGKIELLPCGSEVPF
jgi:hypothetical protein